MNSVFPGVRVVGGETLDVAPGGRASTGIRLLGWLGLLWVASVEGAAPRYDADALRSLAKIPPMQLTTGFSYSSDVGFSLGEEAFEPRWNRPLAEVLREMEGRLKGDDRDAELLLEMALVERRAGLTNRAKGWLERSQRFFQSRVTAAPEDGWLRSQYGRALRMGDRWEEAERAHRAAANTAPRDWRCWDALGEFLWRRAGANLWPSNAFPAVETAPKGSGQVAQTNPEGRVAARRDLEEAQRCLDRAVEVGSGAVEVYANRYLLKWVQRSIFRPVFEPGDSGGSPPAPMFPDESMLADLRRASALTTTNAFAIGMAATFAVWFEEASSGQFDPTPGAGWMAASESRKAYVREELSRLERLAEAESARVAGAAGAASATVRLLAMGDFAGAERDARRSLARYPEGEGAWEVVATCQVMQERWAELAAGCEERLRAKESTRLRIILAKAFERRSLLKEAAGEVEKAARVAPGDLFLELGGVALQLRVSEGREGAEAVLRRMAPMKEGTFRTAPPALQQHFELLHGIAYGLAGDPAEARRHFRRLVAADPGNPDYRKALDAAGPAN